MGFQAGCAFPILASRFNANGKKITLYTGWIERALIGILMVMGIFTGLAPLATLKTLARFKQLENRANAKYFILGTLLSILLGVSFGALFGWVLHY